MLESTEALDTEEILGQQSQAAEKSATSDSLLSKKARKRQAKDERYAEVKLLRRAKEKEAKKEKKRIRAEKRAAGELDEEDERPKKKQKVVKFGGSVVVDLGFDEKMTDKEIKSLTSQLAYTYSANRRVGYPFSLIYTSLNGRTLERLESLGDASYKRWARTTWMSQGYEKLWSITSCNAESKEQLETSPAKISKESVIYLTADSDEELSELRPEDVYVIGGIVDRNRYKNLCQDKATKSGVRTARLPIGKYISDLPTRKVLTVNQVFEIMLKWAETQNWEEALYTVIPRRKFQGKDIIVTMSEGEADAGDESVQGDTSDVEVEQADER